MEKNIIESDRYILNQARDGHFCDKCGVPATNSCTDAHESKADCGETKCSIWTESGERYGCGLHPVEPMIYFVDGSVMTAKEWEASCQ
jgi:hypothetical protein